MDQIRRLVGAVAPIATTPFPPVVVLPKPAAPPDRVDVTTDDLLALRQAWRDFAVCKQELEKRLPQLELERYALLRKYEKLEEACDTALVELRDAKGILDDFGDYELDLDKDPSKGGVFIRDDKKN